jgi:hypothetical protein
MRGRYSVRASLVVLLLFTLQSFAAEAEEFVDTITIKDGSILQGEIKRVENDELILDTDYADDVVIDVEYIVDIKSKQQFSIRLIDGEIISGFLVVSKGKIELRESLPVSGEPEATNPSRLIGLERPATEISAVTPEPGADEIAQQASPTGEGTAPQPTPDAPQGDEAPGEIARPKDVEPSSSLPSKERFSGRTFTFADVDWIREKPTFLRYDADFNVGVQLARGNSDTTDLHFDSSFEPSFGWNTFRLSGRYDKKTADGDTTTNRWLASLSYERDFFRRWFVGAANTYESDAQRDLDLRVIAGAGVGYRFFDEDPTHLSVLPALAYVNENFKEVFTNVQDPADPNAPPIWEKSSEDTDYVAFQLKFDFTRDLYKDDITFFQHSMYLNSLQDLGDIIVETRTGIKFDMPWDLLLTAEVETDWENKPAEDAKKWDTRYMLKIGFEFEGDQNDWFH